MWCGEVLIKWWKQQNVGLVVRVVEKEVSELGVGRLVEFRVNCFLSFFFG